MRRVLLPFARAYQMKSWSKVLTRSVRITRAYIATCSAASASEGSNNDFTLPNGSSVRCTKPVVSNQPSCTAKIAISPIATR